MGTAKLTAFGRIIRNSNFVLITVHEDGVRTLTHGKEDLEGAILIATSLLATYNELMQQINDQAAEGGELHALQALRDATAKIEKANDGKS